MMRGVEEHLAEWARREIERLGAQSALFGTLKVLTTAGGTTNLKPEETALRVKVVDLAPAPEGRDVGPDTGVGDHLLHMTARVLLSLIGPAVTRGIDVAVEPPAAHVHGVDLVVLALLARLRERPVPGPDGGEPAGPGAELGTAPGGAVAASAGPRRALLSWQVAAVGGASVYEGSSQRKWEIPLTLACTFRLSPVELEGGRILQVETALTGPGLPGKVEMSVYGPAEALSLDRFDGLGDAVLVELSAQGVTTLGELGRLGQAGAAALAEGLATAAPAERAVLTQLAEMVSWRQGAAADLAATWVDPRLLALPARALLAPTEAERIVLSHVMLPPAVASAVRIMGQPVAIALRPESREQVRVGTLLAGRR